MNDNINCKNDCLYRENGECRLKIEPYQSIFSDNKPACIYYNKRFAAESVVKKMKAPCFL